MKGVFLRVSRPLVLVTVFVFIASAQPVLLTDSLSTTTVQFVAVSGGGVVFLNSHGKLSSVDINDPLNTREFSLGWTPDSDGWAGDGECQLLKASPDGNRVMLAVKVSIPDSIPSAGVVMPEPVVILVCDSRGGNAEAAGVTYSSDEKLCFDFTQDSRLLFGSRFINCMPDPESYFAHYLGDESSSLRQFDMIDLVEGSRFSTHGAVGSHFISNQWADVIAVGDEGSVFNRVADMISFSILFEDSTLSLPVIDQWVSSEGGLARTEEAQIYRLSDGTVFENPGADITVLCSMPDGSCIYMKDEDESINHGRINWRTFEIEDSYELVELIGYLSPGHRVISAEGSAAIIFNAGRGLYYYELP